MLQKSNVFQIRISIPHSTEFTSCLLLCLLLHVCFFVFWTSFSEFSFIHLLKKSYIYNAPRQGLI